MEIMKANEARKDKFAIVKTMILLHMDNRVLNQMRETMNNQIEDEQGLMSVEDFQKMFFTAYG